MFCLWDNYKVCPNVTGNLAIIAEPMVTATWKGDIAYCYHKD